MTQFKPKTNSIGSLNKLVLSALPLVMVSNLCYAAGKAHGEGHHASISDLTWYFFNFTVYCVMMFFILRKPLAKAWAARCQTISTHVNAAQKQLKDAEARLAHAQAEASAVEARIAKMQSDIASATANEKVRLQAAAEQQLAALKKQSAQLIEAERHAQKNAIEKEISARVLEKAEETLRSEFGNTEDRSYRSKLVDNLKSLRVN